MASRRVSPSGSRTATASTIPGSSSATTRRPVGSAAARAPMWSTQRPTRPRSSRSSGSPPARSEIGRPARSGRGSVPVLVGLVGALDGDADVGGLLGGQLGQRDAEGVEVQAGDLLVEALGEHVDPLLVLVVSREQLDLGDGLIRERV